GEVPRRPRIQAGDGGAESTQGRSVYTHPFRNDCCRNLVPDVFEPLIELGTDTTRTIASLLFSGSAEIAAEYKEKMIPDANLGLPRRRPLAFLRGHTALQRRACRLRAQRPVESLSSSA